MKIEDITGKKIRAFHQIGDGLIIPCRQPGFAKYIRLKRRNRVRKFGGVDRHEDGRLPGIKEVDLQIVIKRRVSDGVARN